MLIGCLSVRLLFGLLIVNIIRVRVHYNSMRRHEEILRQYKNDDEHYSLIARNGLRFADEFTGDMRDDVLRHYVNKVENVKNIDYNETPYYECDVINKTGVEESYVRADIVDATEIKANVVRAGLIDATSIEAEQIKCVVLDATSVKVDNLEADVEYCTSIEDLE